MAANKKAQEKAQQEAIALAEKAKVAKTKAQKAEKVAKEKAFKDKQQQVRPPLCGPKGFICSVIY